MAPSAIPHRPPRSAQLPPRPLRRQTPLDRRAVEEQNHRWLLAYAASQDEPSRRHWRNCLVEANLGLVHSVAARFTGIGQLSFCDLVQVGCQGLIRAVEAFDARRARCLSTFAVPYVRGAIQHELRDRDAWIRPPRRIWELRHRAKVLQEQRRANGVPPLARDALAAALGCLATELDEAALLPQVAQPLSLDALQSCRGEVDGAGTTWLDLLADPRSLPQQAPILRLEPSRHAQAMWLREQLGQLDALQRELVFARVLIGCSWVELGRQFGLHPRMAERRCNAALGQLRRAGEDWLLHASSTPSNPDSLSETA